MPAKRKTPAATGVRGELFQDRPAPKKTNSRPFRKPEYVNFLPKVVATCDGACLRNPGGPGGYGVVLRSGAHLKELQGSIPATTSNRAELVAVIAALSALRTSCDVTIRTDSMVTIQGINRGLRFRQGVRGKRPANLDLVSAALDAMAPHKVTFQWVKGHAGDPDNERCDWLAVAAAKMGRAA